LSVSSIIFDLDDTIIDTSGSITPKFLEKALRAMMAQGLIIDDFSAAAKKLFDLNKKVSSSSEVLDHFLKGQKKSDKWKELGMRVFCKENLDFPFDMTPDARNTLLLLSQRVTMHLVTIGDDEFQRLKLEKAGFEEGFFSTISVCENNKYLVYQRLIEEFSYKPAEVLVCGDRIERDLVPAKELGCQTAHMRWGRGRVEASGHEAVDFVIEGLGELLGVVQ